MPELPEVETVVRGLRPYLEGAHIDRVTLNRKDLRFPFPRGFAKSLEGQTITSVGRRAKYLLFRLSGGKTWLGSAMVYEFETRAALDDFFRDEPYCTNGIYQSIDIYDWQRGELG